MTQFDTPATRLMPVNCCEDGTSSDLILVNGYILIWPNWSLCYYYRRPLGPWGRPFGRVLQTQTSLALVEAGQIY